MTPPVRGLGPVAAAVLFAVAADVAVAAGPATPEAAKAVLQTYCYDCHGKDGRNEGGLNVVTDLRKLVESGRVIPSDPERSKLLRRVVSGDMPPEFDFEDRAEHPEPLRRPSPDEVATLRGWIKAGAAEPAKADAPRKFITEGEVLRAVVDDLRKTPLRDRKFVRYFTLTHMANAGANGDELQTYRHGLSKLVNSLSWNRKVKAPTPVDAAGTVLRIDLRDYLWDEGTWKAVVRRYPYGLRPDGVVAAPVYDMTACELPWVRADWFVYAASRPPLYHEVLRLPETVGELERKLDVDAAANVAQDRVARAAFNASGVSRNNRIIERHESTNGGYWRSYDFGGNSDRKNVFAYPLGPGAGGFEHDGGETIFALPNGLQGYMLVDGRGARIDKGPMEIVRDTKQADAAVVNGVSCMSCHNRGLIEKADQVRDVVEKTRAFDRKVAETVFVLYPKREAMDALFKADADRFAKAVKETGASLSVTEPVFALATRFEEEINVAQAAAESGLEVKDFQAMLNGSSKLAQAVGLLLVGGTVKRDAFAESFPLIAAARRIPLLRTAPAATVTTAAVAPTPRAPTAPAATYRPEPTAAGPGYPADRLVDVPKTFRGSGEGRFHDVGPAGAVLVGLRYTTHPFLGRPKVSSLLPLYRPLSSGRGEVEGRTYGIPTGPESVVVARPGYAVGTIRTRTGLSLDGCVLVFMKIKGDRLDPSDSYESPVVGDSQGGSPGVAEGGGWHVVGLQGKATKNVNSVGIILLK